MQPPEELADNSCDSDVLVCQENQKLQKLNALIIKTSLQDFQPGKVENGGFADLILTDPPIKSSPVLSRITQNGLTLSESELQGDVKHAKQMLITGRYLIIFTNKFTWIDWFVELSKSVFHVMPYLTSFVCHEEIDRDVFIFFETRVS